jgi:magnesium transporter
VSATRQRMFGAHRADIGARPGTLRLPPDSPAPRIRLVQYDSSGVQSEEVADLSRLRDRTRAPGSTTWIDVRGLGDESVLRALGEVFALHPLALEDAVNIPQRAKSALYAEHQLLVARTPLVANGSLSLPQVCLILGPDYLITFQERAFGFFDAVRERIQAGIGPIREQGPSYLAYALLDVLVDRFYPVLQDLDETLGEVEERLVEGNAPASLLGKIHSARRQLVNLRRVIRPQCDMLRGLIQLPSPFISDEVRTFLRDVDDHAVQIADRVDSARELASEVAELHLSQLSHRTNEVMKVLTLMASIFIPLSFIAGVYGMNFDYMPELHSPIGYFVALGIMATVALGLLAFFWRRGWLGSPED